MEDKSVANLLNTPRHVAPGILKYADLPQICATIAPRSFAIFGHDANPAYPKDGYEAIIEVCRQVYSLLGVEKCFSANVDAYPYLNTVTWLMERIAEDTVPPISPCQVTPPLVKGAGGISMRSERGYDQTEFYQAKGVDVEPALAQSNELIHSPWSYLKYRAALAASKLPNEFTSVPAWEDFRESYLQAHAQCLVDFTTNKKRRFSII